MRSEPFVLYWPYFSVNQNESWCTNAFWSTESESGNRKDLSFLVFFGEFIKKLSFLPFFRICKPNIISASNWARELIKKQKNPHGQLIWGGDTFQTSSYHSFSLKPGRVKNTPSLMKFQWLSYFCMIFINLVYLKAELSSQTNNLLVFYTIIFTRHSRLLRASERCFRKLTCFT